MQTDAKSKDKGPDVFVVVWFLVVIAEAVFF